MDAVWITIIVARLAAPIVPRLNIAFCHTFTSHGTLHTLQFPRLDFLASNQQTEIGRTNRFKVQIHLPQSKCTPTESVQTLCAECSEVK